MTMDKLFDAAVRAPSAMNRQPWAFAVIQDRNLLKQSSDRAKRFLLESSQEGTHVRELREALEDPAYNMFYDAGTLIAICAKSDDPTAAEDCYLAAENLMLAALDLGLGTCPIGLARPWLNAPLVKRELGIPENYHVVFPVIAGYPKVNPPETQRTPPEVFLWKGAPVPE